MPDGPPAEDPAGTLVVCGILRKEVELLVRRNGWPVRLRFLDSTLHVDLERLSVALASALSRCERGRRLVVYGACHPRMEEILSAGDARRTPGQNCVELLLGRDRFVEELSKGAYFLFEDWALRWDEVAEPCFGPADVMRQIFQEAHRTLFALRTPCSGDFREEAERISHLVGLPLRWTDAPLDRLERTLRQSIEELSQPRP